MNVTNFYNPSQGGAVISPIGLQKYPEKLNSFSQIYPLIYTSSSDNKFAMDSCWESGNIYYASYDAGYVKKISFDGTELFTLSVVNPLALSIIQYDDKMSNPITYPPQQDRGSWIIERDTNTLVKTDSELNVLLTYSGLSAPYAVMSTIDGGCIVYNSLPKRLYKFDLNAQPVCSIDFSSLSPTGNIFKDLATDINGVIWLVADDVVYNLSVVGNSFIQNFVVDPITDIDSYCYAVPTTNAERVASIDVDRNDSQILYVSGGNDVRGWVIQYDKDGYFLNCNRYSDITYPYITKVVQGYGSQSVYLLSDPSKWDSIGYGSSSSSSDSSSSSYIENWSSSSTSSSSGSSSSNSSSSSSSAGWYDWVQRTGSGSRNWLAITSNDDGTRLVAADYGSGVGGGLIYTSNNYGVTWTSQVGTQRSWSHMASSYDGLKLAACVFGDYIYTSADGGSSWTQQTGSVSTSYWKGVASSYDGVNLAAVIEGSYVYTSNNSGVTWIQQVGSGSRTWKDIASSSDGTKLAAAVEGDCIYTSNNSGVTWTQQIGSGIRNWGSVASNNDGTILLATVPLGYTYTSIDSGITWTQHTIPHNGISTAMSYSGNRMAVGCTGGDGYIHVSTDYGSTWTRQDSVGGAVWAAMASDEYGNLLISGKLGVGVAGYIWTGTWQSG